MNKKIIIIFTVLLIIVLIGGYFAINYFKVILLSLALSISVFDCLSCDYKMYI